MFYNTEFFLQHNGIQEPLNLQDLLYSNPWLSLLCPARNENSQDAFCIHAQTRLRVAGQPAGSSYTQNIVSVRGSMYPMLSFEKFSITKPAIRKAATKKSSTIIYIFYCFC